MRAILTASALCLGCLGMGQTVKLQLKFPSGRADRVTSSTHMVQSVSMAGQGKPMQMVMDQGSSMLMKVTSSTAQGATVKMTYESMTSSMTMNGTKSDQLGNVGKSIKGKSVTLSFAPDGKLKKVSGFSELVDTKADAQAKAMMQQMFSEDSIRQMWSMNFGGMVPGKPVKVGDSWTSSMSLGQAPMKMSIKMTMRLNKVVGSLATIGLSGTGTVDMSGFGGPSMSFKTKSLTVSGTSTFDIARGWMKDQNMVMSMSGVMVMTNQGKKQEMPISSKMTSKTTVKQAG